MIRSLFGEVLSITEAAVLLDVNGLGFDILCSRGALASCSAGSKVRLTTHMQFSEAGAAVFGFSDERERELFLKITSIKGIGGRTGMSIMAVLSVDEIVRAVSFAELGIFMRVPGVGRKSAERLCFELKNSLPENVMTVQEAGVPALSTRTSDTVAEALGNLGFAASDAAAALAMVRAARGEEFDKLDDATLLRAALKELQGRK